MAARWNANDGRRREEPAAGPEAAFTRAITDAFDPSSRARGRAYERQGRVTFVGSNGSGRRATVIGTSRYSVGLDIEASVLFVECTCPVGPFCKHTWATLLAAERRQDDLRLDVTKVARVHAGPPRPVAQDSQQVKPSSEPPAIPRWRTQLDTILGNPSRPLPTHTSRRLEALFVLDVAASTRSREIVLHAWSRPKVQAPPRWTRLVPYMLDVGALDPFDRAVVSLLGSRPAGRGNLASSGGLLPPVAPDVLRQLAARGSLAISAEPGEVDPIACSRATFDEGPPWCLTPMVHDEPDGTLVLDAQLERDGTRVRSGSDPKLLDGGLCVMDDAIARYLPVGPPGLSEALLRSGPVRVPTVDRETFARTVLETPSLAEIALPPSLGVSDVALPTSYVAEVGAGGGGGFVAVAASVEIDGLRAPLTPGTPAVVDFPNRRRLLRDRARDAAARALLASLGCFEEGHGDLVIPPSRVPGLVRGLLDAEWVVFAEGRRQRRGALFKLHAASGIDWFDLEGSMDFGGVTASLPELLRAVRTQGMVRLGDGSVGVVPEEWLARWAKLSAFGEVREDDVRFRRSQASLLDALLAAQPEATCDEAFARLRGELRAFRVPTRLVPPSSFLGSLRPYQQEGLGWLAWLGRLGLGGCLADDMGLGKTVQVIAYLLHRAAGTRRTGPSLVVAPRSVVDHWVDEAARFAPHLHVVAQVGTGRSSTRNLLSRADLIVTSYATLRRDAPLLAEIELDCLVLDEAQALKNPDAATTKAARTLRARQRVALSGTPIENHLGELWSIFDVVSPGMLGSAKVLRDLVDRSNDASVETASAVARAVRPFLLRRRKREVARDLPERTEETLHCTLGPAERALYDDLARHYRDTLLGEVRRDGMKRTALHVLEALLRLRQAACHPGLLDRKRRRRGSAKLDLLFEQLETIADADAGDPHKVLVFSQFTSLLDLVEPGLDQRGITYERLDGKTVNRAERVARFQEDPEVRVFLLSLKAGGTGLNLTAADYVYLLDPWWNPAVEAQAIDRAHRIGQDRPVVAYRLIARDTIEERVAELQGRKRALADAILENDAGTRALADLTADDLERLLA
ncbi:MAG: DEAD/DEAH box helicase [Deltaproteobacteria bacterium]|nr:DEAD/DEAH box helicase [Deltaproteobacteria bacterium]